MGTYFNPTNELPNVGRKLLVLERTFDALSAQLAPDEVLVGHYDRLIFQNCPLIDCASELEAFESQVRNGQLLFLGFYALPKGAFDGTLSVEALREIRQLANTVNEANVPVVHSYIINENSVSEDINNVAVE